MHPAYISKILKGGGKSWVYGACGHQLMLRPSLRSLWVCSTPLLLLWCGRGVVWFCEGPAVEVAADQLHVILGFYPLLGLLIRLWYGSGCNMMMTYHDVKL